MTPDPPRVPCPAALQGFGVAYFGNDWRAENRTSSHHVATRLARCMPVLYVDSPGMRAPSASGRDLRRALRKLRETLQPPRRVGDNLWHCTVPQLPFRHVPGVDPLNRAFGRWAVRRALRLAGIRRCLSWFVVPHPGFLAGQLDEALCVYYCIDDYAAHPGVDADAIAACDDALSRRADVLFVASPALMAPKRALNPHVVPAPHGVDLALFARAADPATPVPDAARELQGPVVGYIGSLHEWIDIPLLAWLAAQRPQWSFLLVGQVHTDIAALRALRNVHLAGAQPYDTLPGWARAFDVAVIPYRLNRQVAHANPLKLREYLATGKPVVSVRNPEIEKFSRWVRLADGREQFLAQLDAAVSENDPQAARDRMAAVAGQDWNARVDDVLASVAAALDARRLPEAARIAAVAP
jgi:glycosyltransferase involved in cell wall biosynthesis